MKRCAGWFFPLLFLTPAASAATVYPLDRATILAGLPFDFKVEFDGRHRPEDIRLHVNGREYATVFKKKAHFIPEEKDNNGRTLGSALIVRECVFSSAGIYAVDVSAGNERKTVRWEVYQADRQPKVKNIIFFLADGLSIAHRTTARIMSKGMTEGKANGRLHIDSLDRMAFIGTSATDSLTTDSANTMSAYMTGHKSAVNALGVYADRTPDSLDDPRVETLGEALRRTTQKSLGIVSTAEIADATPAALVSHTRNRDDKAAIVGMFYALQPDILLGGGSAYFLPRGADGSKRGDDSDYIQKFRSKGYAIATSRSELHALNNSGHEKILGLFHPGDLDTALDRLQLGKGTVERFPDQPGLVDMTRVALERLATNPNGFFLMVEGASIDKMSHKMDWERALFETIEFDQAVGLALEFAQQQPDTLIIVTADHTHGVSLIGTVDDTAPGDEMREKIGLYQFPDYEDKDQDGFPDRVDVSRRLLMLSNNYPDYYETFRPKLDGPFVPAVRDGRGHYIANRKYADIPGAVLRTGILPYSRKSAVHAVDDVILQASGPQAENFRGYMEQSDVYRILANALGFGVASGPGGNLRE